jgi:hypothetical protein
MARRLNTQVAEILAAKTMTNEKKQDLELDRKIDLVTERLTTAKFCELILCLCP